ncbi:MAG: hypothetical protein WCJ33_00315 [Pseudomonadota bacterium]
MACLLTSGINALACKDGTPGVIEAYITELSNISSYTETAGVVTAITMASGTQFWRYQQIKESSSWTEDLVTNVQAGSIGYGQTLNLVIPKRDVAKRNELKLVAQNTLAIICKDSNGLYWFIGLTRGADLDNGSKYDSGIKLGDGNGWTLVFKGSEHDPAPSVDSAIIAALLTPAS